MSTPAAAIDAIWRTESPKLVGALTRLVRDLAVAEELAQDALVAALEQWPRDGIPENPAAWLMRAAKHRAIDLLRHGSLVAGRHEALAREAEHLVTPDLDARLDDVVGDDLLRLIFISCHPLLSPEAQVALTLKLLGGLTTAEIARAFLVPEPTIAQRIVRAKRTLSEARVPFELPTGDDLAERLASVLGVIYLVFNEGYSATAGDDVIRPGLCDDALRLGRLLAKVDPGEPEVHALLALMELQTSRFESRVGPDAQAVPLLEQDRSRWNHAGIARGLESLRRVNALGGALGLYALQASIAACHATARTADETDWGRIAALYDVLATLAPQPIVELNRAVAHAMVFGPEAGLEILDGLATEPSLEAYHLLPAVRGDLLERAGRHLEARVAYERAAGLAQKAAEKSVLLARAARMKSPG
ncbi:MAG: RNA polymerase sigma factor [Myxococcales bacterium]|nr:RNA polymerase sigma factor [Myxococcales bacterium]